MQDILLSSLASKRIHCFSKDLGFYKLWGYRRSGKGAGAEERLGGNLRNGDIDWMGRVEGRGKFIP